ncbi:Fic family protein [Lactococcus sp. DD01]|uniref:Fic family protein n=1 Tax=Lactococcus sp. DD01 TaxID=1776443 RepID=UPI00079931E1|nr:Fic family protein [Lactococcus sp. DD01]KXT59144.1 Huntingtin interacting protein E-like protein [Lactococcus sp. DD01]
MEFNEIDRLKTEMDNYRPLSLTEVKEIERQKKMDHIWSSSAIEGNTLTKYETISFLETGLTVSGKPIKDYLEILDLNEAFDFVKELSTQDIQYTLVDIMDINRIATLKTSTSLGEAGKLRRIDVWPNGFPEEKYVSPSKIEDEMKAFLKWYNEDKTLHPVEKAALTHFKLVSIHPFIDGNGRTSRLLMNMELMKHGYPIINIQPDKESRQAYMEALQVGRNTNDTTKFVKLVSEYVKSELSERIEILKFNQKEDIKLEKKSQSSIFSSFESKVLDKKPNNKFEERLQKAKAEQKKLNPSQSTQETKGKKL